MKLFLAKSPKEWRNWLEKNHAKEKEIWLVYYKKHTGIPSISYLESVEVALCFGWIDGIKKRIDDEKYTHRFTLRRARSNWSSRNITIAQRMIEEKKMTPFGLAFFERRKEYKPALIEEGTNQEIQMRAEIEQEIKNNKQAWKNFSKLASGYKKQYVEWIMSARKDSTRHKRLKEALKLLEKNLKLGMK